MIYACKLLSPPRPPWSFGKQKHQLLPLWPPYHNSPTFFIFINVSQLVVLYLLPREGGQTYQQFLLSQLLISCDNNFESLVTSTSYSKLFNLLIKHVIITLICSWLSLMRSRSLKASYYILYYCFLFTPIIYYMSFFLGVKT